MTQLIEIPVKMFMSKNDLLCKEMEEENKQYAIALEKAKAIIAARNTPAEKLKLAYNKYQKDGIVSFTLNVSMKENNNGVFKKQGVPPNKWNDFTLETEGRFNPSHNCIAIVCGKPSGVFCVDVDEPSKWEEYLKSKGQQQPQTVFAKTAKGIHLYFKYEDRLKDIPSNTGLYDCFDVRSNKSMLYAPGSNYIVKSKDDNGNIIETPFAYSWGDNCSVFDYEMEPLPDWLFDDIVAFNSNRGKVSTKAPTLISEKNKELKISKVITDKTIVVLSKEEIKTLVGLFSIERSTNYDTWRDVGFALSCLRDQDNFKIFDEFSKKSKKYDARGVFENWNMWQKATDRNNKFTYNSLAFWAREDNLNKYLALVKENKISSEIKFTNTITFSQEFLAKDELLETFDHFLRDQTKVCILKSNYGTGKTTLLSKYIGPLGQIKDANILMITYRISLANSFKGTFSNFEMYKDLTDNEIINSQRLIVQLDSLPRIAKSNIKYDYIILDESESILNHFNASTFTTASDTYSQLIKLCKKSKKSILLDGDISDRSKTFAQQIVTITVETVKKGVTKYHKKMSEEPLMIINKYNKICYDFILTSKQPSFLQEMKKKLKEGKNVAIVSMTKADAEKYTKALEMEFPEKKFICYTSNTSEEKRNALIHVNKEWVKYDGVIYSSVIEAGVNFDVHHFDSMFVHISAADKQQYSCGSERALYQMMSRIRHFENNEVLVYKGNLSINEKFVPLTNLDIKKQLEDLFASSKDSNNFKEIIAYNKAEEANKLRSGFMYNFREMAYSKGHKLIDGETGFETLPSNKTESLEKVASLDITNYIPSTEAGHLSVDYGDMGPLMEHKYKLQQEFNMEFNDAARIGKYFFKANNLKFFRLMMDYIKTGIIPDKTNISFRTALLISSLEKVISILNFVNKNWKLELIENKSFKVINGKDSVNVHKDLANIVEENLILFGLGKPRFGFLSWKSFTPSFYAILGQYMFEIEVSQKATIAERKEGRNETIISLDCFLVETIFGEKYFNNNITA